MTPSSSAPKNVLHVAHHPAASACAAKFLRPCPPWMIAGGVGLVPQDQAFGHAVLQAGGTGT
jgi:hypothetical protein